MSSSTALSSASLSPSHLPSLSAAKAVKSSGLGGAGSTASASGDTTSYVTNADGSISITTTNAQGQIVSIATQQAAKNLSNLSATAAQTPGTLLDRFV